MINLINFWLLPRWQSIFGAMLGNGLSCWQHVDVGPTLKERTIYCSWFTNGPTTTIYIDYEHSEQ